MTATFGLPEQLFRLPSAVPGTYRYDDPALLELTEQVRILDSEGKLRYEGDVDKGVCTGWGRIYDPNGVLCYDGPLVESRCEGGDARVYQDGVLIYVGEMEGNLYEGEGRLIDPTDGTYQEGSFRKGFLEGMGRIYDSEGRLLQEGEFHRGVLQGDHWQEGEGGVLPPDVPETPGEPEAPGGNRLARWLDDVLFRFLSQILT